MKQIPFKKNDLISPLEITDLTSEGFGVGKYNGTVIFVPKTAVGDIISAKILKPLASYGYGKCEAILAPSADRCEPGCPVFTKCGGCLFRHIRYDAELRIKKSWVEENFKRIGNLPISCDTILPSPEVNGYRNKAQIPCGIDSNGMPAFGFFAAHSHRIIPCEACCLQPDFYPAIIRCLTDWMVQYGIKPYDEQTQTGTVRHLFLRDGRDSGEIMVCIVANADSLPHADALVYSLRKVNPKIASIVLNVNRKKGNSILGEKCVTLWGKDTITDRLCGLFFDISPLSFYQVNHDGAELLYQTAADFAALSGMEVLLDLYCGVGTIGLSMADAAASVLGVEIVPQAVENAKENARQSGISNAEFLCGDAGTVAQKLEQEQLQPDVIVVDPPRKGCDQNALDAMAKMQPERIVMISCHPATAARDCAVLQEMGYVVQKVQPVDLFPGTGHVECVVLMSRKQG